MEVGKLSPIAPQEMNVLSGQLRIGTETKEENLNRLADFFAKGFLSRDEWEARQSWVLKARTQEQIDMVFTDLPEVTRFVLVVKQENMWKTTAGKMVLLYLLFIFILGISSIIWG